MNSVASIAITAGVLSAVLVEPALACQMQEPAEQDPMSTPPAPDAPDAPDGPAAPPAPPAPPATAPASADDEEQTSEHDAPGMMDAPDPMPRDEDDDIAGMEGMGGMNGMNSEGAGRLLSGPQVADSSAHTLVRFDAQGRFQRAEGRPEEAALVLLDIDSETREAARQAAAARRETLREFLIDQIDLLIESTDAQKAGDREKVAAISRQMYELHDPQQRRDPALDAICDSLPEDKAAELRTLVDEYWSALADWELRNNKNKTDEARQRIFNRMAFELFQRELGQAYERTLRPIRNKFEAIIQAVEPTEEQRLAIRGILHEHIRHGRLDPPAELQQETARKIYDALDEPRRRKLFEMAFFRL